MTRARDIADQQDNLGGAVAPFAAGKNVVINGGMDFFQRVSFSTTATGYGLDRWLNVSSGSASASVVTQQTTGVPSGSRYCMRITMGASGGYGNQYHLIETSNVIQLLGRTATLTLKIRRNATFAGGLSVTIAKSATVDAGAGATWTTLTATGGSNTASNASLPTGTSSSDWLTISYQVAIPNDGTANSLRIGIEQTQVEASGAYWELAQVQLEAGSQATTFTRAGGSIGGELALCQRYYQKSYPAAMAPGSFFLGAYSTTIVENNVPSGNYFHYQPLIVQMRAEPTITIFSGAGQTSRVSTTGGSDLAALSAVPILVADNHFTIQNQSGGSLSASGGGFLFYYVASSEL
jgi:hypothetical protein